VGVVRRVVQSSNHIVRFFGPILLQEPTGRVRKPGRSDQEQQRGDSLEGQREAPRERRRRSRSRQEVATEPYPRGETITDGKHDAMHRHHEASRRRCRTFSLIPEEPYQLAKVSTEAAMRWLGSDHMRPYMGIVVMSMPIPKPAMNLATKNMPIFAEPAQSAAPTIMIAAPSCMERFRPNLSALQDVNPAPKADPAEFRPFMVPMRLEV